jgi:hypothetical protein
LISHHDRPIVSNPTGFAAGHFYPESEQSKCAHPARSQPTVNSGSPHYGVPGDKVKVMQWGKDQHRRGSDLNWCKVQFVQSKAIGWIRSDCIIFADG